MHINNVTRQPTQTVMSEMTQNYISERVRSSADRSLARIELSSADRSLIPMSVAKGIRSSADHPDSLMKLRQSGEETRSQT